MRHKSIGGWLLVLAAMIVMLLTPATAALAGFTPTPTGAAPTNTQPPPPPTTPTNTPQPPPPPPPASGQGNPVINKAASLNLGQVGSRVDFTITVTNQGSGDANNVVVVDSLPGELDFVGAATSQGSYTYDAASHTVTVSLGTLTPGQVATITIQTRVNSRGQPPLTIANSAELFMNGNSLGRSNTTEIQMIPSSLPTAGLPPDANWLLTGLLAGLALLAPIAGWLILRRPGRIDD